MVACRSSEHRHGTGGGSRSSPGAGEGGRYNCLACERGFAKSPEDPFPLWQHLQSTTCAPKADVEQWQEEWIKDGESFDRLIDIIRRKDRKKDGEEGTKDQEKKIVQKKELDEPKESTENQQER